MPNQINISQDFSYQSETSTHSARVVADGGTIDRLRDLDNKILFHKQLGIYNNVLFGWSTSYGQKNTSTLIDKLYDWSPNARDFVGSGAQRPVYSASSRFNKSSLDFVSGLNGGGITSGSTFAFSSATNSLSLVGWLRLNGSGGNFSIFGCDVSSGPYFTITKPFAPTDSRLNINYYNGASSTSVTPLFWDDRYTNAWMHLAIVFNFTTAQVFCYRNGILVTTTALTTPSFPNVTGTKYFGGVGGGSGFIGGQDDMTAYNIALTSSQIGRLMNEI